MPREDAWFRFCPFTDDFQCARSKRMRRFHWRGSRLRPGANGRAAGSAPVSNGTFRIPRRTFYRYRAPPQAGVLITRHDPTRRAPVGPWVWSHRREGRSPVETGAGRPHRLPNRKGIMRSEPRIGSSVRIFAGTPRKRLCVPRGTGEMFDRTVGRARVAFIR